MVPGEGEKATDFIYDTDLGSLAGRPVDSVWTGTHGPVSEVLCTPRGNPFELATEVPATNTNDTSVIPTPQGSSRQLPPLPNSPPTPSAYDIFNPFADPFPSRSSTHGIPCTNTTGNEISNEELPRWLIPNAQRVPSPSHRGPGNISLPQSDRGNDESGSEDNETFDSKWARHMEERSQRISEQQRQRNLSVLGINSLDVLAPDSNDDNESERVAEARQRRLEENLQTISRLYPFSGDSNTNRPHPDPSATLPPIRVLPQASYRPHTVHPSSTSERVSEPYQEPWRRQLHESAFRHPNERPDIQSRNAALDTISNLLFNFDCPPDEVAGLLEDTCATANQVGVSTAELLAQTVTLGNFDLGMTALCLEASRCDLSGGLDVLTWLLENVSPGSIEKDLRRGCLMRNNGMGDQFAWSTMKLFVPEEEDHAVFAYDVTVDHIFLMRDAALKNLDTKHSEPEPKADEDSDDGSLYDDVSFVDAESSLNQADIETLKSSSDEGEARPQGSSSTDPAVGPRSTAHRARIDVPYFESSLKLEDQHIKPAYTALPYWHPGPSKLLKEMGIMKSPFPQPTQVMPMKNRVLTAEWMYEGRVWALAMGENKLVLTLRHASEVISSQPVNVKAIVRIFPSDIFWSEVEELNSIGPDRLLPTQSDPVLPIVPVYTCDFDEVPLVPGPPALPGNTSVYQADIYKSQLSLLELIGPSGAMKVEVLIKTTEISGDAQVECPSLPPSNLAECSEQKGKGEAAESVSGESDSEWQQVNF
ncbi:hypothetical protein RhiLY_12028 [Ceratobasidium sp. AG-Ba]|nr:hypothetical protein RhiLY_12028 [Ceratobasidium sp. AG-Ba]